MLISTPIACCQKYRFVKILVLSALGLITSSIQAVAVHQSTGKPGLAIKHASANLGAMAKWESLQPPINTYRHVHPRMNVSRHKLQTGNSVSPLEDAFSPQLQAGAQSPTSFVNFLALLDDGTSIPPDTDGSVGPNHIVTALNTQVRIQNKSGTVLSTVSLQGFWSPVLGARSAFDPRCQYDPYYNRWIMTAAATDSNNQNSAILVAVSQTLDPTGNWNFYSINADPTNSTWADYDQVGFSSKWITVTANMFAQDNSYVGVQIYALNKLDFYNNGSGKYTLLTDSIGFSMEPCQTYDPTLDTHYMMEEWNGSSGGQGYLRMDSITGNVGSETLNTGIAFPAANLTWNDFDHGDFAPQSGTATKISSGDGRMLGAVYRNGTIWCTHNIFLPTAAPTHTSVQWWQIDLAGNTLQLGRIDDSTGALFRAYPSIAVNANNDVLIGYTRFSSSTFASAFYSFRYGTDAANTMQSENQLKAGEASYVKDFGGPENRWGDYSATVVDPLDDLSMWTLQEYASSPSGGEDRFGTWWGEVQASAVTSSINIPNFGFETPSLAASTFQYRPTGASWTFTGNAGIAKNGSAFTNSNPNAPEGVQVAILQGGANIAQSLSGFQGGFNYRATVSAAQRGSANSSTQSFQLQVDGQSIGTFTPASKNYADVTSSLFTVSAGSHTFTILGTNPNGGDNTAFIDNVRITGVSNGSPAIAPVYLVIYAASGVIGQTAGMQARMTGPNSVPITGRSVTFSVNGTAVGSGTTDINGFAKFIYPIPLSLGAGVQTLTASFSGDPEFSAATRNGPLTVLPISDVIGLGPVTQKAGKLMYAGARLATLTGTSLAGKNLNFSIDGSIIATLSTDATGSARLYYTIPQETTAGAHTLTAAFAGDSVYAAVSKTVTLTVPLSNTSLAVYNQTVFPGQPTKLQCRLFNEVSQVAPGRTVTFSLNGTVLGTAVTNSTGYGIYSLVVPDNIGAGAKTISVSFAGDTVYNSSTGSGTLTIIKTNSSLYMLNASVAAGQTLTQPVRLIGSFGNYISGRTISLKVNGISAGTAVTASNGVGGFTYVVPAGTAPGNYTMTASFAGDADYNGSTFNSTITVK